MGIIAMLLPFARAACTWSHNKSVVSHGWWFCCEGMDGTVSQPVNATFQSPVGDKYSFRVGIYHDPLASCDHDPDTWWPEQDYADAFPHSSYGMYSANYAKEKVVAQLWCHNMVENCNLEMIGLTIGTGTTGASTMGMIKNGTRTEPRRSSA